MCTKVRVDLYAELTRITIFLFKFLFSDIIKIK